VLFRNVSLPEFWVPTTRMRRGLEIVAMVCWYEGERWGKDSLVG